MNISYKTDKRTVLTLDAGGTNFVFSAMQAGKQIVDPIGKPSNAHDLDLCMATLIDGFSEVNNKLKESAVAISFAFPGPADYKNGIIGDLGNLPAFRGGVALGPMLEKKFDVPVFINNDGDLYAYGEAIGGILPEINSKLEASGSPKRYSNLVGITLGTGFGGGIVNDGNLFKGDNSIAAEVWLTSNRHFPNRFAEEGISTRAIQREYKKLSCDDTDLMPFDIFKIANDSSNANSGAAKEAFAIFGRCLGDAMANMFTLTDSVIVIGGGLSGAAELYMPAALDEMNSSFESAEGENVARLVQKVFYIDNENEYSEFVKDTSVEITIPGTTEKIKYDSESKLAVCTSNFGASEAISLGAYVYALSKL